MYAPPYPLSLLIHLFLDKLRPIIWLALHIRLPIAILTQPLVAVLRTFSTHVIWPFNSTISRWAESSPHILSSDNIPQHTCTNHNRECRYLDQFIFILLPDIPSWLGSTSRVNGRSLPLFFVLPCEACSAARGADGGHFLVQQVIERSARCSCTRRAA